MNLYKDESLKLLEQVSNGRMPVGLKQHPEMFKVASYRYKRGVTEMDAIGRRLNECLSAGSKPIGAYSDAFVLYAYLSLIQLEVKLGVTIVLMQESSWTRCSAKFVSSPDQSTVLWWFYDETHVAPDSWIRRNQDSLPLEMKYVMAYKLGQIVFPYDISALIDEVAAI